MKNLYLFGSFWIIFSCTTPEAKLDAIYLQELNSWKSTRINNLKQPMGYLSMVGLHWLKQGKNTIGSSAKNDIVLSKALPKYLGYITFKDDKVWVHSDNTGVKLDGLAFFADTLKSDTVYDYNKLNYGSHFWYLIQRGNRYAIRVKDTLADMRMNTNALPYFEPNPNLIIKADFSFPKVAESTSLKNHVGITYQSAVKGKFSFNYQDQDYELIGTDGGEGQIFIVFGDATNGEETYGGGRFLYVDIPQKGAKALLDFNKAENPICALNDYGTCPYPPAQNVLAFPIRAGELKVR